ncbi:MAG: hypothetical protein Q4F05_01465 [bacterium]|nr:hypothetical protein [bacterium]
MKQLVKGVVLAAIFMTISLAERTCLATGKNHANLSLKDPQYTNDGGSVTVEYTSDNALKVDFNTKEEEEGYYTFSLYASNKINMNNKSVISFHMSTDTELLLNLQLMTNKWDTLKCQEGASIYIKQDKSKTYELLTVSEGVVKIEKGFKGTIYVPIASITTNEQAASINKFGISITQSEEQKSSFVLDNVYALETRELDQEGIKNTYQVVGNLTPLLPACGEYLYEYQVVDLAQEEHSIPFQFALANSPEGVNVSKNGTIMFFDMATTEPVKLLVTVDKDFSFYYTIYPEESWYVQQSDEASKNFIVPSPDVVANYSLASVSTASVASVDYVIRFLLVGAACSYLMFYYIKIRKR